MGNDKVQFPYCTTKLELIQIDQAALFEHVRAKMAKFITVIDNRNDHIVKLEGSLSFVMFAKKMVDDWIIKNADESPTDNTTGANLEPLSVQNVVIGEAPVMFVVVQESFEVVRNGSGRKSNVVEQVPHTNSQQSDSNELSACHTNGGDVAIFEPDNGIITWVDSNSRDANKSNALDDDNDRFEFTTTCGIVVSVYRGDLLKEQSDVIVNPANSHLRHGAGAARHISDAAGPQLDNECRDYIAKNGSLGVSKVMHTTAGNLQPSIRHVIHTVGPNADAFVDKKSRLHQVLTETFVNCLTYANDVLKASSIALPGISSGR